MQIIKQGLTDTAKREQNKKVQQIVEDALLKIEQFGDSAVREMSENFDKWSPESSALANGKIESAYNELSDQDITDITFAPNANSYFCRTSA